jgi:hypothetical protein
MLRLHNLRLRNTVKNQQKISSTGWAISFSAVRYTSMHWAITYEIFSSCTVCSKLTVLEKFVVFNSTAIFG